MNIVYLSPHFPHHYHQFCKILKQLVANVLGIGDVAYDDLAPAVKNALTEDYRLDRPEFGNTAGDLADVYDNLPVGCLPGLSDPRYLNRYYDSTIIICVGQGPWEDEAIEDTCAPDAIFRDKGIDAWMDFWGHDVNHDWPGWYKEMNYFLGRLYG